MLKRFIILFYVLAFIHVQLCSQNNFVPVLKRCPVRTINFEQGLANNGTTDVITDALGFTWISTKTGMQRYNGYILETINPVINKQFIRINSPVYFFALKNGLIWVSYKHGVLEYDPHANSFKKIIAISSSGNLSFSIIPVQETNNGIWCMQYKKGLIIYSARGAITNTISTTKNAFIENVFNKQQIFKNGNFTTNENLIFIYNGKDQIQQINLNTHQIKYINADKNIYGFTCSNNKIYTISNKGLTIINIDNNKTSRKVSFKNIINENVNTASILLFGDNQLLVGLNSHFFELDTTCNYEKEFTNSNKNPVVAVGYITTIYADRFKRIWLLTNDDIKRIQNVDIPFEHFIYANEKNNFTRSLYYDEKKHVLIAGCLNGGIQLYDTLGNTLWQKPIITDNVKDILSIEKLTDNKFLLITFGKGWYILSLQSKHLEPLKIPASIEAKLQSHFINYSNNLHRVNDSTVLIATSFNVFRCIFKKDKIISAEPLLPFTDLTNTVDCFIYSADKTLWAGTAEGMLYRVNKNKLPAINIPDNYLIRSLAEDAQHNIWVGTDKGLYVYNNSGTLIKIFTTQTGLLNDCVYALLPVENKTAVFASSNLGLSQVYLNGNIINYTKESGLQENEFNTQSAVKTINEKYYFGGVNGITSFYPSSLLYIKDTPVLNITRLVINDSLYNCSPGNLKGDSLKLNYSQNHIQLDFAALGLLNTNEYVYKYRLKGFETNLQTTHQPTGIKYILEPGSYTFEITCAPIFSSDNIFKKTFTIFIYPAWWQTWWFKIVMIISCAGVIAFIFHQYNHRKYLKRIQSLQLQQELQQERERISRDLHDNLGAYAAAIASNVAIIQTAHIATNKTVLHQLTINSQSIINQLNDTIWALNKEAISLTAVSDRFKVFLQKIRPNYPGINITVEESILNDEKLSPANALHLFRIMQEATNNALRHSNCSNIFIKIVSADTWKMTVEDDGGGISKLNEKNISGNGFKNIKMRSKHAGWHVSWIDAKPKGTELIISSTAN